jgi:peptide/nickel transport system substrate-binding protein
MLSGSSFRTRAVLTVSVGLLVALSGCTSAATTPPAASAPAASSGAAATAGTATAPAPASAATASGTPFVVASTMSVQKLDPQVATNFLDVQALNLVYDTLVKFDQQLQIVPSLATSWSFSSDHLTLTFQLRQGVKFDDGHTFSSADVVATVQRLQDPKTGAAAASYLASVKSVQAQGPDAVQFVLSRPDMSIVSGLTSTNLAMLSASAIQAGTVATQPDGTGPFTFVNWTPNDSFTVKANPDYWGGTVSLGTVKISTIPNEQSVASALQAGTVQLGLLTQPQIATHLPSNYPVQKVLDLTYRALMLQDKTGPLANVNNRLAMACAIDRTQVLDAAAFGQGQVIGPVPLGQYASNPVSAVCPKPDVAQAKQYLQKAGNPSGFTFTALTSTELDPTSSAQAVAIQSQLAAVGIKMNIQNLAGNAYVQDWLKGTFEAAFAWNGANPDPYTMYGRYFGPGANLSVPAGYSSTKLQDLIVAGDQAATPADAAQSWSQLSQELTSQAVWIWLFSSYDYAVLAPNVQGFQISPTRSLQSLAQTTLH